jgi:hypothetical protein
MVIGIVTEVAIFYFAEWTWTAATT